VIGGKVLDVITGSVLKNMLLVAAYNLEQQKDTVNALNVFPVPDGDTGRTCLNVKCRSKGVGEDKRR